MRNNNINLLIDNLIKSDVLLLKNDLNTKYLDQIVNVDHLITSLKQFVFIIKRFFKKENRNIVFLVKNKNQKLFIDHCLTKLNLNLAVKSITNISDLSSKDKSILLVLLDNNNELNLEQFIKTNLNKKNYFLFNINSILNKDNHGIYSIFAQMNNIKKILFLLVLIRRAIK
jgi:hypothetical protein